MLNVSKIYNFFYSRYQELIASFSHLLEFLPVKIYLAISLFLNISSWALTILFKKQLTQNLIILHYNTDLGVDLIGGAKSIFLIPSIGLVFVLINFFVLLVLLKNNHFKILIHLLPLSAVFANALLLIALGPIYYINFR